MPNSSARHISPLVVGLVAWIVPGGGYFLLGERKRGITVGITIILLFLMGILIGGIRIMDPPGWGEYGFMDQVVAEPVRGGVYETKVEPSSEAQEEDPRPDDRDEVLGSGLVHQPWAEISDKPWFVCQILCGPATLVFSTVSTQLARPLSDTRPPEEHIPVSHSRSWEIGALYTAVAGMLNLLVIIDGAFLASRSVEERSVEGGSALDAQADKARVIPAKQPWPQVAAGGVITRGGAPREARRDGISPGGMS